MYYTIINSCEHQLWGLSQQERISKTVHKVTRLERLLEATQIQAGDRILLLRADYLVEANVINKLTQKDQALLTSSCDGRAVAIWTSADNYNSALALLQKQTGEHDFDAYTAQQLTGGYDAQLRKYDLSYVVKLTADNLPVLEQYLYDKSYKGITDLVTKWCWPTPARYVVKSCVHLNISPNSVTGFGWLLTIIAGYAFYLGAYPLGLLAAWLMTFLDTVDGKLARVTLQSSSLGHVMDHALDIIHPPIWYWCWALGLGVSSIDLLGYSASLSEWGIVMLAAYLLGRVFEGLFQWWFVHASIFCWTRLDSYHRLITARRNPSMIIMTAAVLLTAPTAGFVWVVLLAVLSTALLALRFAMGCIVVLANRSIHSWLETVDITTPDPELAVKLFTGYNATRTVTPLLRRAP